MKKKNNYQIPNTNLNINEEIKLSQNSNSQRRTINYSNFDKQETEDLSLNSSFIDLNKKNIDDVLPRNRLKLSNELEKKIAKLPKFTISETGKNERINSTKYLHYSDYEPLKLYSIPFFFWTIGFLFFCLDLLFIINMFMCINKNNFIDGFCGKNIFEYIVLIIIFLVGGSFFIVARYETITIDKQKGLMTLTKFYLIGCKNSVLEIPIESINTIFPTRLLIKKSSEMTKNCLCKIGITFNGIITVYTFKTVCSYFIIKDIIKIRAYLYKKIQTFESVETELNGLESYIDVIQK
jgi:hypothetical protein